jgi:hypothetical protein
MNYLARKHEKGLAIITWCIDADYPNRCDDDIGVDYMINVDIYNSEGDLIFEDCIGGIQIESHPRTQKFHKEILDSYEYYFSTGLVTR